MQQESRARQAIAEEAAEWFVLHRGRQLSAEQHAEFSRWLKSSPVHIEEYLRIAMLSRELTASLAASEWDFEALIEAARADVSTPITPLMGAREPGAQARVPVQPRWRWQLRWRLPALSIAAVLAVGGILWAAADVWLVSKGDSLVTRGEEQRLWQLSDGSQLDLGANSAATIHFTASERLIRIKYGHALFIVAHDANRRFRVAAGGTNTIAVGTEFEIDRQARSTRITVVQGRVALLSGAAPPTAPRAALPSEGTALVAGEQARVADATLAERPWIGKVNVAQEIAWARHEIAFNRRSLAEVVAEFNRYTPTPIVIESTRLRLLTISGIFNAYDAESLLAFIGRLDGVEIRRESGRILITDQRE